MTMFPKKEMLTIQGYNNKQNFSRGGSGVLRPPLSLAGTGCFQQTHKCHKQEKVGNNGYTNFIKISSTIRAQGLASEGPLRPTTNF